MTAHPPSQPTTARDEEAVWRLATALAASVTSAEVAESLAREGAAAAGGFFANIAVLEADAQLVHAVYRSGLERDVPQWSTLDLDEHVPACDAIRTGEPILLRSAEEIAARYPHPHLLTQIRDGGLNARATLPLQGASGTTLGAVGFGWREARVFDEALLRRLQLVTQLTGLALERALMLESAGGAGVAPIRDGDLPRVVQMMPNAFFCLDHELRITSVNAQGERLLGAPRDEIMGQRFLAIFEERSGGEFDLQFGQALQTGQPVLFEEYSASFATWFEVHAWPEERGLNVSLSNINERRTIELQRAVALNEAEETNARLSFLTEVSAKLAGLGTRAEIFEQLSQLLVRSIADWSTLIVPQRDELVRVAAAHRDPALDGLARRLVGVYPHHLFGPSPGVIAYRSGEPLRLARLAQEIIDHLDDSATSAAYGRTLQLFGDGPGLLVPIKSHGDVVAVMTMVRVSGDGFSDAEVATMEEVAARVAVVLDEARLVENQRETAAALQDAALPKTLPVFDGVELAAGYRAASEGSQVGGDWYDAFELQSGHIALVVGDAAGHGLQAAAMMAQMRNVLRGHLFALLGPSESLTRLSRLIASEEPDAFATIICVEIDPQTGEVIWASAGHPAPILVSGQGTSSQLEGGTAPPIGWIDDEAGDTPNEHHFVLEPADRLLMFTDGLFERRGVDLDIGLTHLMILAEKTRSTRDASSACELILAEMLAGAHEDDVCLLIADFQPSR